MRFLFFISVLVMTSIHIITPVTAQMIEEDDTSARIMVYYAIGEDNSPATSVTLSQFKAHMKELYTGDYNVVALPDVLKAYKKNAPLPKNSIVLTFDGSERSVLTHAAPILKKYKFPFTVFLAPERIMDNNPRYLNKRDVKKLQKMQLVSFGLHSHDYETMEFQDKTVLRRNLNNAVSFYRKLFKTQPKYFAFPNGLYSLQAYNIIRGYGFDALLGEQSGVIFENNKNDVLPRFVMTENYADQNRFKMTANSLPFPTTDITPSVSILENDTPIIGFTASPYLDLNRLNCYATGQSKPHIETLDNRIEIRLKNKIDEPRFRLNCTLPYIEEGRGTKWRWFGMLLDVQQ